MSSTKIRWVLCYDIPDDRRRTRLAKMLDGYGDRIQFSVFEAFIERKLFDNLITKVLEILDANEDSFVAYSLCGACEGRRVSLGKAQREEQIGCESVFIV